MTDREMKKDSSFAPAGPVALLAVLAALAGLAPAPELARAANPAASGLRLSGTNVSEHMRLSGSAVTRTLDRRPLKMLDGSALSLGNTRGQVVVLNFWATWCRSCVHELRTLERLHAEIAPRGGRVVAVSIDQERRNLERFVKAAKLALPVAHDGPAGFARDLDLKQVPLTLVLDRTGAVAWCSSRTDEVGLAETRAKTLALLAAPAGVPAIAGEGQGVSR